MSDILLVDDDPHDRRMLMSALDLGGYNVSTAATAGQAR
jgi:CheY-like chemotaxis protein